MPAQPSTPDFRVIYNSGLRLVQEGRRDEALLHFGKVILAKPDLAEAWWQAALIFLDMDRFPEALRHAARAVELREDEPTVWATWADAVALSGDAEAERALLARLRKASRLPAAFRLRLQDRFGAQRRSAKGAVGKAPHPRLAAIAGLIGRSDFARAEAEAARLLRDAPDSAVAFNMLGIATAARGNATAALPQYQAAIRLDPFFADAFFNMARALVTLDRIPEAERMLRAAIARAPDLIAALVLYGEVLIESRRIPAAVHHLRRAASLAGRDGKVLFTLGRALAALGEDGEALALFQKVVDLGGGSVPDALAAMAEVKMRIGRAEDALADADRALSIDPDHLAGLSQKALILQTLGRFDEASPLFLRSMEADPKNGSTFRCYMTGVTVQPGDPLVDRMIGLIEQPGLSPYAEMDFGFAIAKGLEDMKDHRRAFVYLRRANDMMCRLAPYDHRARLAELEAMRDAFRGLDLAARQMDGAPDAAPIFITGMPRSGTTLVEQIIASHSRVTGGDEMDILPHLATTLLRDPAAATAFRRADTLADAEIAALGRDYLAEVARRHPGAGIVSDKTITSYMYLGLLKLALPRARVILVRRDPRDTLLSIYRNRFPDGVHLYAYDLRNLAEYYATFVEMVEFWRAELPGWFTEVQYETLVARPEEESRRLIAACGLDWEEGCLDFHRNNRQVRTLSVYQVRQPMTTGSVQAWQPYAEELQPMFDVLRERGLLPG